MSAPAIRGGRTSAPGVFMAVLWRDIFVTGRELRAFLAQVILQPLFMLFVFGKVLANLGYTRPGYTHLLFPGRSQYPWPTLDSLRWFQIVTLFNPLTYVSEGMRGALVPHGPHMRPWVCVVVLVFWLAVFSAIGIWGFIRRAID